jgi:TatD DNase family protein
MSAPQSGSEPASDSYKPRYIDVSHPFEHFLKRGNSQVANTCFLQIGINLADPIYRGKHRGVQRHPDDLKDVISRAKEVGCTKLIVTGSDFTSARDALELAKEFRW